MYKKIRPLWAEINLDHLAFNVRKIKEKVGDAQIIAIVKADAYGHGAPEVVETMKEAGAEAFGVAVITEALQLRDRGLTAPLMVLSYTPEDFLPEAVEKNIILNCLDYAYAVKMNEAAAKVQKIAKVLISIDTGIGRLGFSPDEESLREIQRIAQLPHLKMEGIYTHFASSDAADKTLSHLQLDKYKAAVERLRELGVYFNHYHAANSGAVVDLEETYFDSVRPGILLYGYYPSPEVMKEKLELKPVMTLKGLIIQLKSVPKGTGISYGHRFITTREETLIATIPVGYADGYFRGLSGKAQVLVHGIACPQVGSVCMDHIMVDVTDVPGVAALDEVVLLGEDQGVVFNAENMAEILGTIPYEIVCAVSKRVPRIYLKNGQEVNRKSYV